MSNSDIYFCSRIDDENPRGHPILAGRMYAFCPAAARWWKEGFTPTVPFDLLWQVLFDRQTGRCRQAPGQSNLYTAAALALPLFLLRLALYHWHRLVGEEDGGAQVIGDWVAAGALAVATGFMLSLAGILGRQTLTASVGTLSKLSQGVIAVVGTAVLAASIVGTGGAAAAGAGGAGAAGTAPGGSGGLPGGGGGHLGSLGAAGALSSGSSGAGPGGGQAFGGDDYGQRALRSLGAAAEHTRRAGP